MIEIFVALEAAALDRLTRTYRRSTCRTIAPATRTTPTTPGTLAVVTPASLLLTAIVRTTAVLVTASAAGASPPNRTGTASFVSASIPAGGLYRVVTSEQRRHARKAGEAGERRNHTVHGEVLEVESPRCALLGLPVVLGEVAVAIGVRS